MSHIQNAKDILFYFILFLVIDLWMLFFVWIYFEFGKMFFSFSFLFALYSQAQSEPSYKSMKGGGRDKKKNILGVLFIFSKALPPINHPIPSSSQNYSKMHVHVYNICTEPNWCILTVVGWSERHLNYMDPLFL